MPVTNSAIRKQRRDVLKTVENNYYRSQLKDTLRAIRKKKITLSEAYSVIDKSQKKGLLHANRAARLKSQAMSVIGVPKEKAKSSASGKKTTVKKSASKKS